MMRIPWVVLASIVAIALVAGCQPDDPLKTVPSASDPDGQRSAEPSPLGFQELGPGVREATAEAGRWVVRTGAHEVTIELTRRVQVTATGTAGSWDALLFAESGQNTAALVMQPVQGVLGEGGPLEEMPTDPIAWLGAIPGVQVVGQETTTVGGYSATRVDVRLAEDVVADGNRFVEVDRADGSVVVGQLFAIDGQPEGYRTVRVEAGRSTRLWLVDIEDGLLVAFAPLEENGSLNTIASDVIEDLRFARGAP